jgi:(S)-mandelate dehydrogenase
MAKRRLPKFAFDFIEGGCEDELCLQRNEESFARYRLRPRYLLDVSRRDQSINLLGRKYASPFGIAPTGLAALFRPGADLMLAEAAKIADIPFIQSGASTTSIEAVARVAPQHAWYQLYQPRDDKLSDAIVGRARDAGVATFVLTVDSQSGANQERNIRNGFSQPLKITPTMVGQALAHPAWALGYLRHGMPVFGDWQPYAGEGADARTVARFVSAQGRGVQTWRDVERFRRMWPGKFVLKGILHPDDAMRAAQCGVDGLIVSNHGGRKLDRAPSSLDVLPMVHAAVGDNLTLMLDSGIRRGSDIVTAMCLGAKFCFVGRASLYGVTAGGLAGAQRAIAILRHEVDVLMGQLGCTDLARVGPDLLFREGESQQVDGASMPEVARRSLVTPA